MRTPARPVPRILSVGFAVLLLPLAGATHVNVADHDGTAHHIEAAHGGHAPTLLETDERLASNGVEIAIAVPATREVSTERHQTVERPLETARTILPPARGPPRLLQPRAPPHLF